MSLIESDIYQDVPDTREDIELTSSIGGLWPPEKASFYRIKGIYTPGIINSRRELLGFIDALKGRALDPNFGGEVTRISLRAIMERSLLLNNTGLLEPYIEAIIPLTATQAAFTKFTALCNRWEIKSCATHEKHYQTHFWGS